MKQFHDLVVHTFETCKRSFSFKMNWQYSAIFLLLSLAFKIMSPVINWILPVSKEVILTRNELDSVSDKNLYPILGFVSDFKILFFIKLHLYYIIFYIT